MSTVIQESFSTSIRETIQSMCGVEIIPEGNFQNESSEISILGVASMINFSGKRKGRVMLDMEDSLAIKLASSLIGEDYTTTRNTMVLAAVSEINNIFSGSAMTIINNQLGLSLWMAPPVVMTGKNVIVCIPKIDSMSLKFKTPHGILRINVAMEGEG